MPTKKIADIPPPFQTAALCFSSDHRPPSHMVLEPGVYEHTCSACGHTTTFTVNRIVFGDATPLLIAQDAWTMMTGGGR